MNHKDQNKKARNLFTTFVKSNGFYGWHVDNYSVKLLRENEAGIDLKIKWKWRDFEYNSVTAPRDGEKIAIIVDKPSISNYDPFDMACYTVIECAIDPEDHNAFLKLKFEGLKMAVFSKKEKNYQLLKGNIKDLNNTLLYKLKKAIKNVLHSESIETLISIIRLVTLALIIISLFALIPIMYVLGVKSPTCKIREFGDRVLFNVDD